MQPTAELAVSSGSLEGMPLGLCLSLRVFAETLPAWINGGWAERLFFFDLSRLLVIFCGRFYFVCVCARACTCVCDWSEEPHKCRTAQNKKCTRVQEHAHTHMCNLLHSDGWCRVVVSWPRGLCAGVGWLVSWYWQHGLVWPHASVELALAGCSGLL